LKISTHIVNSMPFKVIIPGIALPLWEEVGERVRLPRTLILTKITFSMNIMTTAIMVRTASKMVGAMAMTKT
jgi:hypothetical protein